MKKQEQKSFAHTRGIKQIQRVPRAATSVTTSTRAFLVRNLVTFVLRINWRSACEHTHRSSHDPTHKGSVEINSRVGETETTPCITFCCGKQCINIRSHSTRNCYFVCRLFGINMTCDQLFGGIGWMNNHLSHTVRTNLVHATIDRRTRVAGASEDGAYPVDLGGGKKDASKV